MIPKLWYVTVKMGSKVMITVSEKYKTKDEFLTAAEGSAVPCGTRKGKVPPTLIDWLGDEILKNKSKFVGELEEDSEEE